MRNAILALLALLLAAGCGNAGGGGVIEPENKGAAGSPAMDKGQTPPPASTTS